MDSYLDIKHLHIKEGEKPLVDITFNISSSTALIGQSGSGKSLSIKALLGMVPSNLDADIEFSADFELTKDNIGFVPQNPFTSLSPLTKIDQQLFIEGDKQTVQKRKKELLELVNLDPKLLNRFPMELSGGQLQRVVIAIAISKDPKLLLLDEPTTALDSETKEDILQLLNRLKNELNLLILFVTHDIKSIEHIAKNIIIIKEGKMVEQGDLHDILNNPQADYTKKIDRLGLRL